MAPTTSQSEKIPVVDLGQLGLGRETEPSQEEWQRVAQQLHQAFTDMGCAYLTNHGLPDDQRSLLYESASTFFSLPQEKKNLFKFDPETVNGYVPIDTEKYSSSYHELHEGILARNTDRIPYFQEIPSFKKSIESFIFSCRTLSKRIMAAISISLGKDKDYLLSMHQKAGTAGSFTTMRMNFYPPVPPTTLGNTTRFGAHKDYSTFSLIFQDDNGGLQVLDREGSWLDVPNSPGAVVILAGDFIKYYSNDKFNAVMHQVVIPAEEVQRRATRLSLMYFVHADNDVTMMPSSSSCEKPPTVKEYIISRVKKAISLEQNE